MSALARHPKRITRAEAVRIMHQAETPAASATAIAGGTPWAVELPVERYVAALESGAGQVNPIAFIAVGDDFECYGPTAEEIAAELFLAVSHCLCLGKRISVVRIIGAITDAVVAQVSASGRTVVIVHDVGESDGESAYAVTRIVKPRKGEAEVEALVELLPGFLKGVCFDILRTEQPDRVRCSVVTRKFLTKYRRAGSGCEDSSGTETVLAILDAMRLVPQGSQWRLPDVIRRYGEYVRKSGHSATDERDESERDTADTGLRLIKSDNCEVVESGRTGA